MTAAPIGDLKMTTKKPKAKEMEKFANIMGEDFGIVAGYLCKKYLANQFGWKIFDPWTNKANALEMADNVFKAWSLHHDFNSDYCFQGRRGLESPELIVTDSNNLCEAICLAVLKCVRRLENDN